MSIHARPCTPGQETKRLLATTLLFRPRALPQMFFKNVQHCVIERLVL